MSKKCNWTYLDKDPVVPFPAGDCLRVKNKLVRKGNNLYLQEVDKVDIQEQINSYEDGVSLQAMIARYKRTGDSSVLNKSSGFYADVSGLETNPARVIDQLRNVAQAAQAAQAAQVEKVDTAPADPAPADPAPAPIEQKGE